MFKPKVIKDEEKVPMAFSGMRIEGSNLYSGVMDSSQNNIAANMASYTAPNAPARTVATGAGSQAGRQGISGGQVAGALGSAIGGVTEIANTIKGAEVNRDWLINEDDDKAAYGARPNVGKTVGKSALSGAAAGAAIGSVIPGIGTVIGGVVGGVVGAAAGWIGGTNKRKKYERDLAQRTAAKSYRQQQLSNQLFLTETFEDGGTIDADYEDVTDSAPSQAVILGGALHSQGGNPIVDSETGEKLYETERGEILFTEEQTKAIEDRIAQFDSSQDQKHLLFLGKIVKDILDKDTKDNTKK